LWIFACAPVPSTFETEYMFSKTMLPFLIAKL